MFFPWYSIFIFQTAASILLRCYLWKTTDGSFSRNFLLNMVYKFPMYSVHGFKAKRFGDSLPFAFSDRCKNKQGNFVSSVIHVVRSIIIMLEYYFEIYELTLMFYLFSFIVISSCWSKCCQYYIWFVTWTDLVDILGLSISTWYFFTHGSLILSCLIASRKLTHNFIPCMLTYVNIKTSPKIVRLVIIFQIFPLTWFVLGWVYVVFYMW